MTQWSASFQSPLIWNSPQPFLFFMALTFLRNIELFWRNVSVWTCLIISSRADLGDAFGRNTPAAILCLRRCTLLGGGRVLFVLLKVLSPKFLPYNVTICLLLSVRKYFYTVQIKVLSSITFPLKWFHYLIILI